MSIIYLGDMHGRLDDISRIYQKAEDTNIDAIIQVGDFGVFLPGNCTLYRWIEKRARQKKWTVPWYICFGNHDNWNLYYELFKDKEEQDFVEIIPDSGIFLVKRGGLVEINNIKHLFLGGALSNDQGRRKANVDWWSQEEPSNDEFDSFFSKLETYKPDTVITHDAPLRVPFNRQFRNSSLTPTMLDNIIKHSNFIPNRWYFGHHHVLKKWKIDKIKFYCCGLHGQYWERI